MAHTEFDDLELDETEVETETEESTIPVGATSNENFRLEHKEIKPLKQNLKCGFCETPFSEVPKKGYLYPHAKMEDETDGRNACENCYPVEYAAAIEAGLILPVIKIKIKRHADADTEEPEPAPVKRKRGRPRKHPVEPQSEQSVPVKRKRGRPRKHPIQEPLPLLD